MLGHALQEIFREYFPTCWDIQDLDITNENDVHEKIANLKPQVIINSAAYTNVDKAEEEKELAFQVNAQGVKNLIEAARKINATLVQYSTDYVFEGKKEEGYTESEVPLNPVNIYGASKLEGENELQKYNNYYLIRSSWLFGPYGKNFVQTIINLYIAQPQLKIVNDQFGKPTYALDLARATEALLNNERPFGIYHLVNEPATNWYEFAKKIVESKFSKVRKEIIPVSSEKFPRPAKRPHYSILLNTKRPLLRPWAEALKDYLQENTEN